MRIIYGCFEPNEFHYSFDVTSALKVKSFLYEVREIHYVTSIKGNANLGGEILAHKGISFLISLIIWLALPFS